MTEVKVWIPSRGWALDIRNKKTAIRAVSANRGSQSVILPGLFSFPHLNLPDFCGFLSNPNGRKFSVQMLIFSYK
jgi:hypothetical protein